MLNALNLECGVLESQLTLKIISCLNPLSTECKTQEPVGTFKVLACVEKEERFIWQGENGCERVNC